MVHRHGVRSAVSSFGRAAVGAGLAGAAGMLVCATGASAAPRGEGAGDTHTLMVAPDGWPRDGLMPVVEGVFGDQGPAAVDAGLLRGVCPEEPRLQNHTEVPMPTVCLCFIFQEEVGAVFNAPIAHYPIEILRVGIGWSSQGGGAPDSLEEAIKIYPAGLPNPGGAQFVTLGPLMVDGAVNEFTLSGPGRIINSGPFMVSLEFFNSSAVAGAGPIHDGLGCIPGRNAVFASPGFWFDACNLGVTGNWYFHVVYRQVDCAAPTCPADITGNGVVNASDLAEVLGSWSGAGTADLNDDGVVNSSDLAIVLGAWGPCPL